MPATIIMTNSCRCNRDEQIP